MNDGLQRHERSDGKTERHACSLIVEHPVSQSTVLCKLSEAGKNLIEQILPRRRACVQMTRRSHKPTPGSAAL
jgi:hypothetical protein